MSQLYKSFLTRALSGFLFGMGTLVAVASARMLWDGYHHLKEAQRLAETGDRDLAIVEYESAAKAYVPGGSYTDQALRELSILAKGAEMRGELSDSLHVWEVVRRSIIATRHFYQPNRSQLEVANREIERLREPENASKLKDSNPTKSPDDPSPIASLFLFLGFILWVAGSLALLVTSKRDPSASRRARTVFWVACLCGLFMWIAMAVVAG